MKIFRVSIAVAIWILCILSCIGSLLYSKNEYNVTERNTIIFIFLLFFISLVRIIYLGKKDLRTNKEQILGLCFPGLYFLLFVAMNRDGYVNNGDITGLGYAIFENKRLCGVVFTIIIYVAIYGALVYKTKLFINKIIIKNKQYILLAEMVYVPLLVVINFIFMLFKQESNVLIMSLIQLFPFYYWCLYCLFMMAMKYNKFKLVN